jgi:hypothetical protein
MNEGIAVFFEKFIGYYDGPELNLTFGYFNPHRYPIVRDNIEEASLRSMLTDKQYSAPLSSSFLLYLHKNNQFIPYLKERLSSSKDDIYIIEKITGKNIDVIESNWKQWVRDHNIDANVNLVITPIIFNTKDEVDLWSFKNNIEFDANEGIFKKNKSH